MVLTWQIKRNINRFRIDPDGGDDETFKALPPRIYDFDDVIACDKTPPPICFGPADLSVDLARHDFQKP